MYRVPRRHSPAERSVLVAGRRKRRAGYGLGQSSERKNAGRAQERPELRGPLCGRAQDRRGEGPCSHARVGRTRRLQFLARRIARSRHLAAYDACGLRDRRPELDDGLRLGCARGERTRQLGLEGRRLRVAARDPLSVLPLGWRRRRDYRARIRHLPRSNS